MTKTPTVLITGADLPVGLGTARALAPAGVRLIGLCTNPASRFRRSRLWSRTITVPDDLEGHFETLLEIGRSADQRIVLFPGQDELVLLVSDRRRELAQYYDFVLPEKPVVDLLMDKTAFHQWAAAQGFPVPESHIVDSAPELSRVLKSLAFPVVIKPLFRTQSWQASSPIDKIIKLTAAGDVDRIRFDLFASAPRFLVQRWIVGGDANVHFCLTYIDRQGVERAHYTGRKLLQFPRLTGSTAVGVGTTNAEIHRLAVDVLKAAGLRGLGSVEFKQSATDGRYYITEPTVGRNNLQSYIAVAGGVNLTQFAFCDASGRGLPPVAPRSRKAVFIEEQLAMQAIREPGESGDGGVTGIIRELRGRPSFASFSVTDPMPFVLLCRDILQRRWQR